MKTKYSICVIGVYFGTLPKYFNLWLKSCEENPDIDFIIFADNHLENLPVNVKQVDITLPKMKELADKKLGLDTALNYAYKCCDFKVVYGVIFEDYIQGYDFWGHCDFDMLLGKIREFITDDILMKYDKIFPLGHLALYRNTKECNLRYKLTGSECGNYKEVFTNEKIYVFDELVGIYQIYKQNGLPIYDKIIFADIMSIYKRFKLAQNQKNYLYQAFFWEKGKVFRAYWETGVVKTDEFAYIHFKKRGFENTLPDDCDSFYICPGGFIRKERIGTPSIEEIKIINKYEPVKESAAVLKNHSIRIFKNIFRPLYCFLKRFIRRNQES